MTYTNYNLGILAYGSLIDNPGPEISELIIDRLACKTPFNVEFARKSATRCNAPTLIPVTKGGEQVKAVVLCLAQETRLVLAKNALYRRELHKTDKAEVYKESASPGRNKLIIQPTETNFMGVQTVLYASFQSNITEPLTGELLANLAIESILREAGQQEKDGIRYLLAAKRNGIITPLSEEYESHILLKTKVDSLEEAIEKLDRQRKMYPQY